jgi:dihydroxyacetone kinase-like protein
MKKLINAPREYVDQYLEGILLAHPRRLQKAGSIRSIIIAQKTPGKVAIVTGGGSGHLPLFLGYVGDGLLDGCAVGNVFVSPSSTVMFNTASAVESGKGVLVLFGNYGGDRMNFEMAAKDLEKKNIRVKMVICTDDIASAPPERKENRRGVAGILFAYKVAGAAAARMLNLDEVTRLAQKANENTRTMGVAFSACTIPEVGNPSFSINMEMAGFSISLMTLDDELESLLEDYGSSPFMVFEKGWK